VTNARSAVETLAPPEVRRVVRIYNEFVDEWNRREADVRPGSNLPRSEEDWSKVICIASLQRRHIVMFRIKREPEVRYELQMPRSFQRWARGFMRSSVNVKDVRHAVRRHA
jgi:hypothetical protein